MIPRVDPETVWTVWEILGSYFVLEWLGSYYERGIICWN